MNRLSFDLEDLDVDSADREAFEALQGRFATELEQKVKGLFDETASNLGQLRAGGSILVKPKVCSTDCM